MADPATHQTHREPSQRTRTRRQRRDDRVRRCAETERRSAAADTDITDCADAEPLRLDARVRIADRTADDPTNRRLGARTDFAKTKPDPYAASLDRRVVTASIECRLLPRRVEQRSMVRHGGLAEPVSAILANEFKGRQ